MPLGLLDLFKYVLIALVWLFFLRVLRAVWVEVKSPAEHAMSATKAAAGGAVAKRRAGRFASNNAEAATSSATASAPLKHFALKVTVGAIGHPKSYEIAAGATIGRSSTCTISISADEFASAVHARVFQNGDGYFVEDLGSTNGTLLNGARITSATQIRPGDRLLIGRSTAEVVG